METNDSEFLRLLSTDGDKAMRYLYDEYYTSMCYAVYRVLPDRNAAEDIVQEVFLEVWNKREKLNVTSSLKSYLRRACVNRTLNHIRNKKIKFEEEETASVIPDDGIRAQRSMEVDELKTEIRSAIDELPEKCRIVFSMSRYEEMSYKEIAEKLEISIKTVENQISKALKYLRNALSEYAE